MLFGGNSGRIAAVQVQKGIIDAEARNTSKAQGLKQFATAEEVSMNTRHYFSVTVSGLRIKSPAYYVLRTFGELYAHSFALTNR
jgi:hypothetical protein